MFGSLNRGGSETMVMNLYRNIDRSKIQFDFVVHRDEKGDYEDEILKLGGRIYRVPRYRVVNHFTYTKAWEKLLRDHPEWKIVHGHMYTIASIFLRESNKEKRITIAHSHSTSNGKLGLSYIAKNIIEKPLRNIADYFIACSNEAGRWLFGDKVVTSNKYMILPNAIDVDKFIFDKDKRDRMRDLLDVDSKVVLGHVGRYNYQKNFPFLLDLVEKLIKINKNYIMLQVGDGKNNHDLQNQIKDRGLEENFKLLGVREDIPDIMQAMDVFIFPSINEGLGIVAIEAQASSLPCLLSDTIPSEVEVTNLVEYLPINKGIDMWVDKIVNLSIGERLNRSQEIKKSGYDINSTSRKITDYYYNLLSYNDKS